MYDVFRWLVILTGLFAVGTMVALYGRLGRLVLPQFAMSLLVLSNITIILTAVAGAYARLGDKGNPRVVVFGIGTVLEFVSLLMLYRWYGSGAGQAHMAEMQRGVRRGDFLSRRAK